ncbi:hypothetical protein COP2_031705 [Malus domestica]
MVGCHSLRNPWMVGCLGTCHLEEPLDGGMSQLAGGAESNRPTGRSGRPLDTYRMVTHPNSEAVHTKTTQYPHPDHHQPTPHHRVQHLNHQHHLKHNPQGHHSYRKAHPTLHIRHHHPNPNSPGFRYQTTQAHSMDGDPTKAAPEAHWYTTNSTWDAVLSSNRRRWCHPHPITVRIGPTPGSLTLTWPVRLALFAVNRQFTGQLPPLDVLHRIDECRLSPLRSLIHKQRIPLAHPSLLIKA